MGSEIVLPPLLQSTPTVYLHVTQKRLNVIGQSNSHHKRKSCLLATDSVFKYLFIEICYLLKMEL